MVLGHLLSDLPPAEVYQLHREPPNWIWQEDCDSFEYVIEPPEKPYKEKIALVLSLRATIVPDRIFSVLGKDVSIWAISVPRPHNDFMKSREDLSKFRQIFRKLLDEIKALHGEKTLLHVFPSVPVSVAIEMGRIRMPKADLPLRVYDQNNGAGGFTFALDIT